jgi:hypothetical protein
MAKKKSFDASSQQVSARQMRYEYSNINALTK